MARGRIVRRLLYGGGASLRDYERACLDALGVRMGPEAEAIVRRQLEATDVIQRFSNDRLTVFHLRPGADVAEFRDQRPELRVAAFTLNSHDGHSVGGTIVFDLGRLSSLEFNRPPKGLSGRSLEVSEIELLSDPMLAGPDRRPARARGVLDVAGVRIAVQNMVPPANPSERESYLKGLRTSAPGDYAQVLAVTNGFEIDNWAFLGTESRTLTLPETTYIVVAERLDSVLAICLEPGARESGVLVLDELEHEVRSTHAALLEALAHVTGGG